MAEATPRKIEKVEVDAAADRASATLTYHTNYSAPFSFSVTAAALDELIQTLGTLRINLRPDVPTKCPGGDRVRTVDPEIFVEPGPTGNPVLSVRSLRFGWQHFELPKALAAQAGQMLMALSARI